MAALKAQPINTVELDFGPMLAAQEEYVAPADLAICSSGCTSGMWKLCPAVKTRWPFGGASAA